MENKPQPAAPLSAEEAALKKFPVLAGDLSKYNSEHETYREIFIDGWNAHAAAVSAKTDLSVEKMAEEIPLTEAQITELAHIGSKYVYEGVMEDGRISELGILEVIKKYEEFKRQGSDIVPTEAAKAQALPSPVWVKASEQLPSVGIYNATYNGDHVIFQVHDGGFRVVFYDGSMSDQPKLNLVKWLDESALPVNSELLEALEMHIILNEDDWCRNPRIMLEDFKAAIQKHSK